MYSRHALVVIGASAGGIEPLSELLKSLPASIRAAFFLAVHIPPTRTSHISTIIGRVSRLSSIQALDHTVIEPGKVYVAPPGRHLAVEDGHLRLMNGPKENGARPSIDVLFRTAARAFGPRVVAILLSGGLDDGVAGMRVVKDHGGICLAQDPAEATFPDLPNNAISQGFVDHIGTVSRLARLLPSLAEECAAAQPRTHKRRSKGIEAEAATVADEKAGFEIGIPGGRASGLTCPQCGGAIWEFEVEEPAQYRCHVGHVFSTDSFLDEQAKALETALWTAVRALEEKEMIASRIAARARERGAGISAK